MQQQQQLHYQSNLTNKSADPALTAQQFHMLHYSQQQPNCRPTMADQVPLLTTTTAAIATPCSLPHPSPVHSPTMNYSPIPASPAAQTSPMMPHTHSTTLQQQQFMHLVQTSQTDDLHCPTVSSSNCIGILSPISVCSQPASPTSPTAPAQQQAINNNTNNSPIQSAGSPNKQQQLNLTQSNQQQQALQQQMNQIQINQQQQQALQQQRQRLQKQQPSMIVIARQSNMPPNSSGPAAKKRKRRDVSINRQRSVKSNRPIGGSSSNDIQMDESASNCSSFGSSSHHLELLMPNLAVESPASEHFSSLSHSPDSQSSSSSRSRTSVKADPKCSQKKRQRSAANKRERKRMENLNIAYNMLRSVVPNNERRLSKYETLQMAQQYITALTDTLAELKSMGCNSDSDQTNNI